MYYHQLMKRFVKVNIEISNICNLQCSFCPEVIRSPKLMDLDLFREVVRQVAPITEQVCFHLMGDPLVHPKLAEMITICEEFNAPIFFVTNGVLLKNKFAEKADLLLRSPFRQVNFSLHSFADNFGDKDPNEYLQRIFEYTELAFKHRPDLYLNYRLWNLQEVRGHSNANQKMLEKIESYFGVNISRDIDIRKQKSHRIKNKLYLHFDTEFTWPALHLPVLGTQGTCYGLSSHFGVLVDGTVVPCCLDKEAAIPLGKIQENSIAEILNLERSRNLIEGFKKNRLVEDLCQRCQYIERFQ